MKAFDIALKDMTRSFRSAFAVIFMFVVPLLVTGMFYFMFGNIASNGEFSLPKTKVVIANLDEGGPKFQVNPKNIPGGKKADRMGDLIVSILQSEDLADLIEVTFAPSAEAAAQPWIVKMLRWRSSSRPIFRINLQMWMEKRSSSFIKTPH